MKCDMCNGTGDIKNNESATCEPAYKTCPKCGGQGRYDDNNCMQEIDRYGVTNYCYRPKGHEGSHMTWSEYVASQNTGEDVLIPAGD